MESHWIPLKVPVIFKMCYLLILFRLFIIVEFIQLIIQIILEMHDFPQKKMHAAVLGKIIFSNNWDKNVIYFKTKAIKLPTVDIKTKWKLCKIGVSNWVSFNWTESRNRSLDCKRCKNPQTKRWGFWFKFKMGLSLKGGNSFCQFLC